MAEDYWEDLVHAEKVVQQRREAPAAIAPADMSGIDDLEIVMRQSHFSFHLRKAMQMGFDDGFRRCNAAAVVEVAAVREAGREELRRRGMWIAISWLGAGLAVAWLIGTLF